MSAEIPPPSALYRMISGFYVSQAIYAIVRLGIADSLSDGPLGTEELARRSKSHVQSLKRVLRLLVTVGLFTEDNQGRFALTPIGNHLRAGVPGSMRSVALLFGGITQRAGAICFTASKPGSLRSAGFSARTHSRIWRSARRRLPISMRR